MSDLEILQNMKLAPWIYKGTALIGVARRVGGNQFRYNMATMAILIDYHYTDPILLKASVIHDLFEDTSFVTQDEIRELDEDGLNVLALVLEVTRYKETLKSTYLEKILRFGTRNAKILKCADRISNLTDLHYGIFTEDDMNEYLDETEKFLLPMAKEVNDNMLTELKDLLTRRRDLLQRLNFTTR